MASSSPRSPRFNMSSREVGINSFREDKGEEGGRKRERGKEGEKRGERGGREEEKGEGGR